MKTLTKIQAQAFNLARTQLDRTSKFYRDDLESLRHHYSRKTATECKETIGRLSSRVSQAEIDMHCQTGGM